MGNFGKLIPTLTIQAGQSKSYYIFLGIQFVIFVVIIGFILRIVKLYFESIELQQNKEKNAQAIQEKQERINKTIKKSVKISGIMFVILIITQFIISFFQI